MGGRILARVFGLALLLALSGCDIGGSSVEAAPTTGELRALPADAELVGVAITPNGKRYVLDQRSGLYRIDAAGAVLVFNTTGLAGLEFTDIVALDDARFALTAENDGFLFDLSTGSLTSYFCYFPPLPGEDGKGSSQPVAPISVSQTLRLAGVPVSERTEAVAFNPNTKRLFAQPRTTRLDTGGIAGSELFVFEQGGGQPVSVFPLESGFVAKGMVVVGDRLFLGSGSSLWEAAPDGAMSRVGELDSSIDLSGMARAPDGTLWLLDGKGRRLVKFDPEIQLW